ncbi:MAG TPA: glycosyltransferase family 2 protein [Thermohalobaculum sp.]|nr:glycosyltransferase family 2 protein [Thermohalobaculum sp.]
MTGNGDERAFRKLIIQIPCFNEAGQLPATLAELPREVPGFDKVEWLVIDDGSSDGTAQVARDNGVDHVVRHGSNRGLATAFMTGLEAGLRRGADVIVNTDADNQYDSSCIPDLVAPVVAGKAQMVIGARPILDHDSFSPLKKALQVLGSWVVRKASRTDVPDAPSGFRAISRSLAMRLYVFNSHTYTLETIIQAGRLNEPVTSVPVRVNPATRESRLIKSVLGYILRSGLTIIRIFVLYRPLQFFSGVAVIIALPGLWAYGRFFLFYLAGEGGGHIQSLVVGAALLVAGAMTMIGGFLADMVAANRVLLAEVRSRLLAAELARGEDGQAGAG